MKYVLPNSLRQIIVALGTVFSFSLMMPGCREQTVSVAPPLTVDPSSISTIIYFQHIQPIFSNNCLTAGCHNTVSAASGLILDSWEHLFRGSHSGAVVVSGNAFMTHLMQIIDQDTTLNPVSFPQMPLI